MALKLIFIAFAFVVTIAGGLLILGKKQPSTPIAKHDKVILVALKLSGIQDNSQALASEEILWRGKTVLALIGPSEIYWTDYLVLPQGSKLLAQLKDDIAVEDIYAAEIELVKVPALALGTLHASHILGVKKRPTGTLPDSLDDEDGRTDILPNAQAIQALKETPTDVPLTMINYLKFLPDGGQYAYQQYGTQAMKTVHSVGGQFLFAGRVTHILIDAPDAPTAGDWDSLAAMVYPDPTAILSMEQDPAYKKSLRLRDNGLDKTIVTATKAY